jgi:hypothetical protein
VQLRDATISICDRNVRIAALSPSNIGAARTFPINPIERPD